MKPLLSTLFLLTSALAFPLASDPVIHSQCFKLKSQTLSPTNTSFTSNLYLESYHISPSFNYATLYPPSAQTPGIIGYLNGTSSEIANLSANLLFEGNQFPYGFVIDRVNATYNPVEINAGNGTQGIFIDQGIIKYDNPISGGFYACKNTLLYGPAVQVFFKNKEFPTPVGCEDVELVVEYV